MRLVHTADLHLGYRAYHRTNASGINIREADVARVFRELLERTAKVSPELFLIAGDIFHTVRPSNAAIADAFRQFSLFREEAPDTSVVIIAGNHDSPRAAETGNILRLFAEIPGFQVVHQEPKRLRFPELDTAILCLPHNSLFAERQPAIEPDPETGINILMAHAAHENLKLISHYGAALLRSSDVRPEEWTYVALGHYHLHERLAPNMIYPGAIERTSIDVWSEANRPKGFIELDADDGKVKFHELQGPRTVIDLEPIAGRDMPASEIDGLIESALESVPGGIEEKIIRLRLFDVPRDVYRELDHRKVREYRTQALHLNLDARPPQITRHSGSGAPGRRLTLQEELTEFLKHRWKPDSRQVDREALIELGLRYLQEAEEAEVLEDRE
ncbi:MAG: DNA repair exonuclease [Gemmatimonadota bacterium]|nr:MAG: DNA repair exonuclease [Gemmatimonadota bacterium]